MRPLRRLYQLHFVKQKPRFSRLGEKERWSLPVAHKTDRAAQGRGFNVSPQAPAPKVLVSLRVPLSPSNLTGSCLFKDLGFQALRYLSESLYSLGRADVFTVAAEFSSRGCK